MKWFAGEKLLVIIGMIGFSLAAVCAIYVRLYGGVVLPEGDVGRAFSFNAAIAMFVLSIAALMPVSGLNPRRRTMVRWGFIILTLISYGIETIQHFRGYNPRFTKVGTVYDIAIGGFFGLISLALIFVTVVLALSFFRSNMVIKRPYLVKGIRYAFVSTMLAFAGGLVMVALQSRYSGETGNFIVIHGLGFHALQALPFLGWMIERANFSEKRASKLVHLGGVAWLVSIGLIGIQTILGRTVFELTLLPSLAAAALLVFAAIVIIAGIPFIKPVEEGDLTHGRA